MRGVAGVGWSGWLVATLPLVFAIPGYGLSCTTQSQMNAADRNTLRQVVMGLAGDVQSGNADAVKAQTISSVAAQFEAIAGSIQGVSPSLQRATLTVDGLYLLDATDLKGAQDAQFFCGLPSSSLTVEINIPNLPPGKYALAIVHATGVKNPQALSMVLENEPAGSPTWKVAGLFVRPLTMGGQDGLWFWTRAREYAAKKQDWNAWFYYQTAEFLLDPVDFLISPNLQKLQREAEQTRPAGLPDAQPMHLTSNGQTFAITNLHTGELSDELDLVLTYEATPNQDPVAARAKVTAVMRALLAAHPELESAFHGLWVYASTPGNQHPFALELPMKEIENSVPHSGE